jgi:peptide/nickel transport system permease protein
MRIRAVNPATVLSGAETAAGHRMAATELLGTTATGDQAPVFARSRVGTAAHLLRRSPLGTLGLLLLLVILVMAVAAPLIAPHDPLDNSFEQLQRPSAAHLFGTDRVGHDVFSRVVYGSRISLVVGFGSVTLALAAGTFIGLLSGYFGGWLDTVIQRGVDVLLAFPFLVLALFLAAVIGRGVDKSIYVLGLAITPAIARVARASVLAERRREYIEAARCVGLTGPRIAWRYLLPNISAPLVVLGTTLLGGAVLAEASLSFLGVGVPPPTASWGSDLSGNARDFFEIAPWMAIFPGVALTLTILGFNFFGDGVRDLLDPRLKRQGPRG